MGKYGLLGEKLGHSYSPEIHALLKGYEYKLYEVPKEEVGRFLNETDLSGMNVTIPYKKTVMDYCVSLSDIANLPVGASENGDVIRLSDIARIDFGYPESSYHVTSYGEDVVLVEVSKRGGENTLQIINSIKDVLAREAAEFNGAVSFNTLSDDSQTIISSLSTVIESGIMGILIAVIVIFVFLNDLRATLVIALSIPLSVFFTFIGMRIAGISINLMSISGIVVSLGSIVDASIVVLDQIYKFYQQRRADGTFPYTVNQSIFRGTDIVDKSVIGSNLTTVVVFIPLAMLSGIVGMILYPVSMTFMISIGASLIVAIIFIPFFIAVRVLIVDFISLFAVFCYQR